MQSLLVGFQKSAKTWTSDFLLSLDQISDVKGKVWVSLENPSESRHVNDLRAFVVRGSSSVQATLPLDRGKGIA